MVRVKVIGAGSIGNHLAHAARSKGWAVTLCDIDQAALDRARHDIYPARYGAWDDDITLKHVDDAMADDADIIVVGTPPDTHMAVANAVMDAAAPRMILIEKPVCGPGLDGCLALHERLQGSGTIGMVGYNHTVAPSTVLAEEIIAGGRLGDIQALSARTREHWGGIFKAHPWLAGPQDTYLGFSARGGGACGEHSHAINIWQHFAHLVGAGRVADVSATLDIVRQGGCDYDQLCLLSLRTENGLVGDVIQDVVTAPTEKSLRLQGSTGYLEWHVNYTPQADGLIHAASADPAEPTLLPKTRADDFRAEVDHLEAVLDGRIPSSPLALDRGLDTMMVIAAAFRSHETGKRVSIDWKAGYTPEALQH